MLTTENRQIEKRLFSLAVLVVFFYSVGLTLSAPLKERSLSAGIVWEHWIGFFIWLIAFAGVYFFNHRYLPAHDPYLLPLVWVLMGWGSMTIWRLQPEFGLRQSIWVALASLVIILGLRLPSDLAFLRSYKYLWLTGSIALTALTFVFGTNPSGYGPPMWLGCCGVYLQPSEPLKLMILAYLAAYLADLQPFLQMKQRSEFANRLQENRRLVKSLLLWLPLLSPTLVMTGLALVVLVVQRDLGTAVIFVFLYASMLYLAIGKRRVLLIALIIVLIAGFLGYAWFDVVRLRVDTWLYPWLDPSGDAYQIVQGLMAVANGGIFGRGPGMGNPWVVPVVHSDLIFVAIAEETGLVGGLALLSLFALLVVRGFAIAITAGDDYRRLLAAGIALYFGEQAVLIIGGSLRLFPLTGVTLPFVSYGGSSLLVSALAILLLMHISRDRPTKQGTNFPLSAYQRMAGMLVLGLFACGMAAGWWAVVRNSDLLVRTDNPRRVLADLEVARGSVLDRDNRIINLTVGAPGAYQRRTQYPPLSNVVGYNHPIYGQAGLEASLDAYLRGEDGYPMLSILWNHLLYGQPLPGLDVRLSLDLDLQRRADLILGNRRGALLVLNAASGEILAMASHPTFDANLMGDQWQQLITDPASPFLNRALLGRYPVDNLLSELGFSDEILQTLIADGILQTQGDRESEFAASPLDVSLFAAALLNGGEQPSPRLALAVHTPHLGWQVLPPIRPVRRLYSLPAAQSITAQWQYSPEYWGFSSLSGDSDSTVAWFIGGTMESLPGVPFAVVVVLEDRDLASAEAMGKVMLRNLILPGVLDG